MSDSNENRADSTADFFKHWQESFNRILQAAGTFTPDTLPPEMLRQIRSNMFQAMAKSWEEFLRSPQFLEGMKQMMDNAIAFRRLSSDFLTKARQEMQGTSRQDVDDMLLAMREMEARLTRRVDELAAQMDAKTPPQQGKAAPRQNTSRPTGAAKPARKRK